jgi:hypothetical protein
MAGTAANFLITPDEYSYCDFSHLYLMLYKLFSFNSSMQYGQLASRIVGILVDDWHTLFPCIRDGMAFKNNRDYSDVGRCSGKLFTHLLDSAF